MVKKEKFLNNYETEWVYFLRARLEYEVLLHLFFELGENLFQGALPVYVRQAENSLICLRILNCCPTLSQKD